jgi:hypothetical protein
VDRHRWSRIALVSIALLCLLSGGIAAAASRLEAHYECYWWSEDQMVGLNPNKPPPKETRVRIERWEYSDPIGVPNPDEVILVIHLGSTPPDAVSVRASWLTKKWSTPELRTLAVRRDGEQVAEVKIPVRQFIYQMHPKKLRSVITVKDQKDQVTTVDLPIVVGD